MKTAFLNSICHEIRTPLNSIAGFSELIFDESLDTATRQEFRQLIQSNSVVLASLMDNMLELSQLVSSEQPLPVEFTDIYRLCVEEMAKLKETLHNPNIECIITGDKDEATAPTNAFYLSRVIGNLLSNSAKFTESGTITVTCNIEKERKKTTGNLRHRYGHRHPRRQTGMGIRTLYQSRRLQTGHRTRSVHLPHYHTTSRRADQNRYRLYFRLQNGGYSSCLATFPNAFSCLRVLSDSSTIRIFAARIQ